MMIVVGIDQSEGAKAALRFALDEARLRHVPLHAVHAWQFGFIGIGGFEGSLPVAGGDLNDFRRAAEAELEAALDDVVGGVDDVDIKRSVLQGTASAVLVDESRGADMLVVGSRGHGGFAQLLLGSVSQQCAHHAECPVVIVRSRTADR
jgi:nucleotide-binding universal stress UspA family protein